MSAPIPLWENYIDRGNAGGEGYRTLVLERMRNSMMAFQPES